MPRRRALYISDLIRILEEYRAKYCDMRVSIVVNHGTEIPMRECCFSYVSNLPRGHLNYDLIIEEDRIASDIGGKYGRRSSKK
jgi:hypothetical protein